MPLTLEEIERRAFITNDQATLAVIRATEAETEAERENHGSARYSAGFSSGHDVGMRIALSKVKAACNQIEELL